MIVICRPEEVVQRLIFDLTTGSRQSVTAQDLIVVVERTQHHISTSLSRDSIDVEEYVEQSLQELEALGYVTFNSDDTWTLSGHWEEYCFPYVWPLWLREILAEVVAEEKEKIRGLVAF